MGLKKKSAERWCWWGLLLFLHSLSWVKDWKKTGNTQVSSVVWVTIVVLYVCVVCLCVLAKNTPLSILPLVRVFISFVFSHVCHTHTSRSSINKRSC
jgi:apolipoprotein N-acyltransferase